MFLIIIASLAIFVVIMVKKSRKRKIPEILLERQYGSGKVILDGEIA